MGRLSLEKLLSKIRGWLEAIVRIMKKNWVNASKNWIENWVNLFKFELKTESISSKVE